MAVQEIRSEQYPKRLEAVVVDGVRIERPRSTDAVPVYVELPGKLVTLGVQTIAGTDEDGNPSTFTLDLGTRRQPPRRVRDDDHEVSSWAALVADGTITAEVLQDIPEPADVKAARELFQAKAAATKKISDWTLAGFARGFVFDNNMFSLSANAQLNWNSVANELNAEAIENGGKVPSDWRQGVTMQPVGEYVLTAETGPEFVKAAIAAGKAILDPQRKASAALAIATTTDEVAAALALLGS